MVNTKIIADLPIELGIKRTYKGYFFLIAALELAITDQKNLLYMSKSIFPVIAARYGTTYNSYFFEYQEDGLVIFII